MFISCGVFFKKLIVTLYNIFNRLIFRSRINIFSESFYKNKKIIVVGPAESSLNYMVGASIDQYFDVIVRINKSPFNVIVNSNKIGSRTDVLYHCFNEDPIGGGGPLDFSLLTRQGCRYVIYPYFESTLERNYFSILRKYPREKVYRLDRRYYSELKEVYAAKIPTTGLQALNHILKSEFKELHITGFTFFHTGYAEGYRDGYETVEKGRALAESAGNHSADAELRTFQDLYKRYAIQKTIYIDGDLEYLINKEYYENRNRS